MKVSVVIPAYNAAHLLSEAIDSVRSQTFTDWELWIVDDGSTDNTQEIVDRYCRKDERIQLVTQKNSGVSSARNLGVARSQGELIAFLDADDRWLPEKLRVHVEFMNSRPEVGVSFARVEFLTVDGIPTNKRTNCSLINLSAADFLYTNPTVTTSNVVVRRELFEKLQGFDQTINYSEDIELLFRSVHYSGVEGIDRVLVRYRVHNTGLSSTLYRMEAGWHKLIEKARTLNSELVDRHYASAYASYLQYLARQTLRLKSPAAIGVDFVDRAFQSDRSAILKNPKFLLISIAVYTKFLLSYFKAKSFL